MDEMQSLLKIRTRGCKMNLLGNGLEIYFQDDKNMDLLNIKGSAVVVAKLLQGSLPIQEVRGSGPVIGKIYIEHLFTVNYMRRRK